MARPRQFALVLLCATATLAGWSAARLGGFEWSDIETYRSVDLEPRGGTRGYERPLATRNGRCHAAPGSSSCLHQPLRARPRLPPMRRRSIQTRAKRASASRGSAAAEAPAVEDGIRPRRVRRHRPKPTSGSCPC